MTLPASFPLSMSQIAAELGLSFPLSIEHAWVLALANKAAAPISFSDLLGKTGRYDGNLIGQNAGGSDNFIRFGNYPFFGGTLFAVDTFFPDASHCQLSMGSAPNWNGNIFFKNNTTGVSVVFSKTNSTTWQVASNPANLIRNGITDNFTVLPSN